MDISILNIQRANTKHNRNQGNGLYLNNKFVKLLMIVGETVPRKSSNIKGNIFEVTIDTKRHKI